MNAADCCDPSGKCKQGDYCPAREESSPLIQTNSDASDPYEKCDSLAGQIFSAVLWACAIWALCVVLGMLSGYLVVKLWP
jgi:hypothetical protein